MHTFVTQTLLGPLDHFEKARPPGICSVARWTTLSLQKVIKEVVLDHVGNESYGIWAV